MRDLKGPIIRSAQGISALLCYSRQIRRVAPNINLGQQPSIGIELFNIPGEYLRIYDFTRSFLYSRCLFVRPVRLHKRESDLILIYGRVMFVWYLCLEGM